MDDNLSHKDFECVVSIIDSIERILNSSSRFNSVEEFSEDKKTFNAIIRDFIVIGEMVDDLSNKIKVETVDVVDWRELAGFRNTIAHDHSKTNVKEVWQIIQNSLINLNERIVDYVKHPMEEKIRYMCYILPDEPFYKYRFEFSRTLENLPKIRQRFETKLTDELCSFIKEHYPNKKIDHVPDELKSEVKSCARSALERFATALEAQMNNYPHKNSKSKLLTITSREKSEKQLKEYLLTIPEEAHDYMTKTHWEDFERNRMHELFQKGIHDKIKEVLVDFFEDDILKLKSKYLRLLDNDTQFLVVFRFIPKIYKLLGK